MHSSVVNKILPACKHRVLVVHRRDQETFMASLLLLQVYRRPSGRASLSFHRTQIAEPMRFSPSHQALCTLPAPFCPHPWGLVMSPFLMTVVSNRWELNERIDFAGGHRSYQALLHRSRISRSIVPGAYIIKHSFELWSLLSLGFRIALFEDLTPPGMVQASSQERIRRESGSLNAITAQSLLHWRGEREGIQDDPFRAMKHVKREELLGAEN